MPGHRQIARPVLLPLSFLYGLIVWARNLLFDTRILRSTRFKLPVIAVGNITVGGTGKTPHVEYLIRLLKHEYKIAVLSRGYKRKTRHFILATTTSGVTDIGDEPRQMKLKFPDVPIAVERNRVKGVQRLMECIRKLDLVILDDAFQHRAIRPGISILLVDYHRPIFHDILLPAGNLREPARNANRADIIIVTKCPDNFSGRDRSNFISRLNLQDRQAVYFTGYAYGSPIPVYPDRQGRQDPVSFKVLKKIKTRVMLVSGIANPAPLRQFLAHNLGIDDELVFTDHHDFDFKDIQRIKNRFKTLDSVEKCIIVTEKDAVRLREIKITDKRFRKSFYYVPVEVKFRTKGEKPFNKKIHKYLKKNIC
ncbi:MAG: tetraacyldisaccharide 4'-kinase [Bacteroidales bacterium]|nr:tetraacyldisaccharide 4'-kinase [Bacteroidales bacterium]